MSGFKKLLARMDQLICLDDHVFIQVDENGCVDVDELKQCMQGIQVAVEALKRKLIYVPASGNTPHAFSNIVDMFVSLRAIGEHVTSVMPLCSNNTNEHNGTEIDFPAIGVIVLRMKMQLRRVSVTDDAVDALRSANENILIAQALIISEVAGYMDSSLDSLLELIQIR